MIKLPKPLATEGVWYPNGTDNPGVVGDCYTEAQMLQFRRDALDEAANEVESLPASLTWFEYAKAIRALKEQT